MAGSRSKDQVLILAAMLSKIRGLQTEKPPATGEGFSLAKNLNI
jgi:hypothetical protein